MLRAASAPGGQSSSTPTLHDGGTLTTASSKFITKPTPAAMTSPNSSRAPAAASAPTTAPTPHSTSRPAARAPATANARRANSGLRRRSNSRAPLTRGGMRPDRGMARSPTRSRAPQEGALKGGASPLAELRERMCNCAGQAQQRLFSLYYGVRPKGSAFRALCNVRPNGSA